MPRMSACPFLLCQKPMVAVISGPSDVGGGGGGQVTVMVADEELLASLSEPSLLELTLAVLLILPQLAVVVSALSKTVCTAPEAMLPKLQFSTLPLMVH